MTDEQFAKLPKFVQEEIKTLRQQRDTAVAALKKWTDEQTPSAISIMEMECLEKGEPDMITRYIQGRRIQIIHKGLLLRVMLTEPDSSNSGGIDLQWGDARGGMDAVAFIPKSYQHAELVAKENMR